jgi:hypothetical protein
MTRCITLVTICNKLEETQYSFYTVKVTMKGTYSAIKKGKVIPLEAYGAQRVLGG